MFSSLRNRDSEEIFSSPGGCCHQSFTAFLQPQRAAYSSKDYTCVLKETDQTDGKNMVLSGTTGPFLAWNFYELVNIPHVLNHISCFL